jgi:hypothetical protein
MMNKNTQTHKKADLNDKRVGIERWCCNQYGDVFQAMIHLKVIRLHVESVLKYGISTVTMTAEVRPFLFLLCFFICEV